MGALPTDDLLPRMRVTPPGPRSRQLAARLRAHESPNVTFVSDDSPIFWSEARGANVLDVDGNLYLDLTAGFGVAAAGHRNPRVVAALRDQLGTLAHGLGDVHPPEVKVTLLERLADITPPGLEQAVLASSGAEAVESALKTARLASGRPGVLCFRGAYHGLTYGALAVTDGDLYRAPFSDQLGIPILRVPYPHPFRPAPELAQATELCRAALDLVSRRLDSQGDRIGTVIVEPIQGRAGVVVPPPGYLTGLRRICDRRGLILVFDEIFTGFGRTGRWFACEHEGAVPDLLCLGKALSGSLPFSACIGRRHVMAAWPESRGAAIHTSTFLGNPLGCAAAIAHIAELEDRRGPDRARRLGAGMLQRFQELQSGLERIGDVRGRGLLAGLELVRPGTKETDPDAAARVAREALRRGVIVLTENGVLTLSPPLSIGEGQLDFACGVLEDCLRSL